ncbi:MAG: cation:proton antiporter [Deltaproteobacteria bacterium]|nr:cation:proton antiporter [Deltaproteobacteria bacterium]MBW2362418.1 cation:proton antiporter [Deltaproteobacteria bacterium]
MDAFFGTLISLALALFLSLGLGRVASRIGVPRVTVYLLVGLVLGPHVGQRFFDEGGLATELLLGPHTEAPLWVLKQLAIGFILFGVGSAFRFQTFREVGPRILGLSAAEIGMTGLLVGLAVGAGTGDWRLAVIAPALAISSAPSATLVTLREVEAEGPTSRNLILCVGNNNLVALFLFPLLFAVAFGGGHPGQATAFALLALVAGGLIGFGAAVWLESITGRHELVLLGLLVVLAALGLVHWIEPGSTGLGMLACFAAGVAVANGSPHADALFRYVENTVYPLYVLFFIAAGRDLHLEAVIQGGALGVLFILARAAGKYFGARIGLRLAGWGEEVSPFFGAGLMCQAGIALGLVATLEHAAPDATAELRHVVVASVVVFELVGPWLVRQTAVGAGEVKLANLLPHEEAKGREALRWVLLELRRNLGMLRSESALREEGPTVRHAMRRRPRIVSESLPFERVLKALGETGADLLPVVDAHDHFKGVISYEEIKNTLYDPMMRDVVIAEDLTSVVEDPLEPESSLATALEVMDRHRVHSWPVVEGQRLLGMVSRTDLYSLMQRS